MRSQATFNANSHQTKILTYASSVHEICSKQKDQDGALVLLKELMESFSQAVVGLSDEAASLQLQEALAVEAKKLFLSVTKLSNLHSQPLLLLVLVERPFLLQQILQSVIHLSEGLKSVVDWTTRLNRISDVIQNAVLERSRLLDPDDALLRELTHDLIQSSESCKDLARTLQKKKRKLFKESVHQHRDPEVKQAAKQDVRFVQELIGEVNALIEQQPSNGGMDASVRARSPAMDESMASMSGPALPPWAVCPVSKRILIDPVTVRADCNHTLSKSVFQEWLNADNTTCPVCGCKLKALCAKANKQLRWKLEELEDMDRTNATIADVPTSARRGQEESPTTRRFSTGDFTSGKMVVPETNKSAADKAPMTLKGEGISAQQQQQQPLLTPSQVLQWTSGGNTTTSAATSNNHTLEASTKRQSLASIVEHESRFGDASNAPLTLQQRSDLERQASENTQVISNCAKNKPNNNAAQDTATSKTKSTKPAPDASNPTEETTNHSSTGVSFSPTVVTNFIGSKARAEHNSQTNTIVIQEAGRTKVVSSYAMVDRSKLGKKPSKNPVKKLFQKVMGGSHKSKTTKPSSGHHNAVSSAKISVKFASNSNSLDSNTDMTADLSNNSNGSHSRTNATGGTQAPILKKNTKPRDKSDESNGVPSPVVVIKA